MTIAIKSNIAVKLKKLTDYNISGLTASLDFRDGTYKKNGVAIALTDLIKSTRSSVGGVMDAYTNYNDVVANTLRIGNDPTTSKKGLFIEAGFLNYFKNAYTPANQSITLSQNISTPLILDIVGTGSIAVSKGGVLQGTATQNNPVVIFPDAAGSVTYDFVVSGAVTHAMFYASSSTAKRITRPNTLTANSTIQKELVQMTGSQLNALLGGDSTGCVVIKLFAPNPMFEPTKASASTTTILQFIDSTTSTNGVFLNRQLNGTNYNFLRVQDSVGAQSTTASKDIKQFNIFAVNISPTTAKMAVNGLLGEKLTFTQMSYATLNIASNTTYSDTDTYYVEEILFFDRELTDAELQLITKN